MYEIQLMDFFLHIYKKKNLTSVEFMQDLRVNSGFGGIVLRYCEQLCFLVY